MAGQLSTRATEGYIPTAAKNVPTYETPGLALGSLFARRMMYPITAKAEVTVMKGPRFFVFSDHIAQKMVKMVATAYGGMVSS
jgi:hypothetical protein